MYGLIKSCHFYGQKRTQWQSHYCGLCLALSEGHGQLSRLTTNSDSVIISALCEAQNPSLVETESHYCPFRKQHKAEVITPNSSNTRYAALISTLIAASKIHDHIVDGDSWIRHFPRLFQTITARWKRSVRGIAGELQVHIGQIEAAIYNQSLLEATSQKDFFHYSKGIEAATGIACSQTAVISGMPSNQNALFGLGKMFGRIIYLLDSYQDYYRDLQKHIFNPLAEDTGGRHIQARATQIFHSAYASLKGHFNRLHLVKPALCSTILETNVFTTGQLILSQPPGAKASHMENNKKKWFDCCDVCSCCDCINCCTCDGGSSKNMCDCPDCGCCDCDCGGCDCSC